MSQPFKVKRLVWVPYGSKFRAKSPCGLYVVSHKLAQTGWWLSRDNIPIAPYDSEKLGMAAGQADFENRIRAGIILTQKADNPMAARQKYIKIDTSIIKRTDNSVLVIHPNRDSSNLWIPRTCLAWETDEAIKRGEVLESIKVVDWWARKNGLA